jgi:arylsulfatase A-like enzyme
MPFVMSWPQTIAAGSVCEEMVLNLDFAATFLDAAAVTVPSFMQGESFLPLMRGETVEGWRTGMYYRYWMHGSHHNVYAHYGIRTHKYKLIYYYADPLDVVAAHTNEPNHRVQKHEPEWELFDLEADPCEMHSVYDDPAYAEVVRDLKDEMHRLQAEAGDDRYPLDRD